MNRRSLTMLESTLQSKIIKQLTSKGFLCVKLIQTNLNGIPDIMCLRNGIVIFIEVKSEKGKVRPLQEYRHKQLREHGFEVLVVNDINQIKQL